MAGRLSAAGCHSAGRAAPLRRSGFERHRIHPIALGSSPLKSRPGHWTCPTRSPGLKRAARRRNPVAETESIPTRDTERPRRNARGAEPAGTAEPAGPTRSLRAAAAKRIAASGRFCRKAIDGRIERKSADCRGAAAAAGAARPAAARRPDRRRAVVSGGSSHGADRVRGTMACGGRSPATATSIPTVIAAEPSPCRPAEWRHPARLGSWSDKLLRGAPAGPPVHSGAKRRPSAASHRGASAAR